jgi:hypothetical protein
MPAQESYYNSCTKYKQYFGHARPAEVVPVTELPIARLKPVCKFINYAFKKQKSPGLVMPGASDPF